MPGRLQGQAALEGPALMGHKSVRKGLEALEGPLGVGAQGHGLAALPWLFQDLSELCQGSGL